MQTITDFFLNDYLTAVWAALALLSLIIAYLELLDQRERAVKHARSMQEKVFLHKLQSEYERESMRIECDRNRDTLFCDVFKDDRRTA